MADKEGKKSHKAEQFTQSSCLSEGVYDLICGLNLEYAIGFTRKDENVVSLLAGKSVLSHGEERMALLITVAKLSLAKKLDGSLNFAETIKKLIPFVHYVHEQLMQLNVNEFEGKFGMDLDWTANKRRILECFRLLKDCDVQAVSVVDSSLLLFTILERSLGDVYASYTGLRSPTNLKDLFMSEGIQELLGEDVCLILYAIAGPPESVNLRNVIWHGFIAPSEIPPQCISFLIFTMAAIGSRFCSSIKIGRRPLIQLTQLERLYIFPNIKSSESMSAIRDQLLTSSVFVSPSMLPIWERALQHHEDERYDLVLVLLFPLLENALRMVFALANKCPKRILTAESTTLYTTFDEILAPLLPDGTENQLQKEIGDEYLQMLLDILVYADGPRIRDRISHGEVDLDSIPSEMSNHVLCICVAFASMFASASMENLQTDMNNTDEYTEIAGTLLPTEMSLTADGSAEKISVSDSSVSCKPKSFMEATNVLSCPYSDMEVLSNPHTIGQIILKARSYQSVYHPTAMLKSEVKDLSKVIDKWKLIPSPGTEFEKTSDFELLEAQEKMLRIMRTILDKGNKKCFLNGVILHMLNVDKMLDDEQFSRSISLLCDDIKAPMLFRPRKELEVVSLLGSIVNHCKTASDQVLNTANQRYQQWCKKELRSRQRANYKRLLSLLPFFKNVIKVVLVFLLIELPSLQENTTDVKQAGHVKFLKHCLQSTENLESLGGPSKNKWDECKLVGQQLIKIIEEHFS